ncbi:MAG: hypothetical protein ACI4S4_01365, partial [Candidatus Ornithospirochaeta sp.]
IEYNYNYSQSLSISSSTVSIDSVVVERIGYKLSPDGILLLVEKNGNPIYFTEDKVVVVEDGEVETYLYAENGESDIEWLDDGGYVESTAAGYRKYDGNGRVVEAKENDTLTTYLYSEGGELLSSLSASGGKFVETKYNDSRPYSIETRSADGSVEKRRIALEDGTFEETRFLDGKPRYVFHIDRDGERILEARGL